MEKESYSIMEIQAALAAHGISISREALYAQLENWEYRRNHHRPYMRPEVIKVFGRNNYRIPASEWARYRNEVLGESEKTK